MESTGEETGRHGWARSAEAVAGAVLLVMPAAGCDGGGEQNDGAGAAASSTPVVEFNEADARFASEMILHHQSSQAVAMAKKIELTRTQEITTLRRHLQSTSAG